MKRSEMVQKIYYELIQPGLIFESDEDKFLKWQANDLLEQLEKIGMLPPKIGIGEFSQGFYEFYVNEWEPEELFSIDPVEYEKWKKKDNKLS